MRGVKKTGCHTGGFRNWSYENRSNVKEPHIALLGVSKVFVLIARQCSARCLRACGSAELNPLLLLEICSGNATQGL